MNELYFQMLRNGIEELRTEKYSIERNGISEALQITLNNLQDEVKNHVVLDNVSKCDCGNTLAKPISLTEYECVNCGKDC